MWKLPGPRTEQGGKTGAEVGAALTVLDPRMGGWANSFRAVAAGSTVRKLGTWMSQRALRYTERPPGTPGRGANPATGAGGTVRDRTPGGVATGARGPTSRSLPGPGAPLLP